MANPTDYLLGYWELDDATDAHGSLDLTESGTVTYTSGEGADLGNSSGFLRIPVASAGALQLGLTSQSWYCEFKFDAAPAAGSVPIVMFGYDGDPGLQDGFGILINSSSQLLFRFSDGSTQSAFTATGTYTTGTWYKAGIVMHRTGLMVGYVNNTIVGSVSISTFSGTSLSSPLDFVIGGELATRYYDGRIRRVVGMAGVMSGDIRQRLVNGADYAELAAITEPYVAQEFVAIGTGSNVTAQSVGVSGLVAGQVALVIQSLDGNSTSHSLTAWDGSWTQIVDAVATQLGTAFCRLRTWWKVVTSTDVSTETQIATSWSSGQEGTLIVQLWDNCVGVDVYDDTPNTATSTSHTAPSVTTTVDGCVVQALLAIDAAATVSAADSDLTFNGLDGRNGNGSVIVWHGTELIPTAGPSGTYDFTTTDAESAIAATIAMEPAVTATDIEPDDASVAVAGQATTISQVHQITPNAGAVSVAGQAATISQVHTLTPTDGAVGVSGQATTITQIHVLIGADGSVSVTAQATTVTEGAVIQPADGSVAVAATATTISQVHLLLPANGSVSVSAAVAAIIQNHVFTPTAGAVAVTVANATITQITPTTLVAAVSAMGAGIGARPAMGSGIGALSTLGN